MNTSMNVKVQEVQNVKHEIAGARDLFELTASRLRGNEALRFNRTLRVLREHGTVMTKEQLHTICQRLERAGIGRLYPVKNGKDFRFEVFYGLVSIAKVALGEAKQLLPLPKTKLDLPELTAAMYATPAEPPVFEARSSVPMIANLPMPVATPAPVSIARAEPKMIKVRYGAFEMEVPLEMDAKEREQAAELIAALPQIKGKS